MLTYLLESIISYFLFSSLSLFAFSTAAKSRLNLSELAWKWLEVGSGAFTMVLSTFLLKYPMRSRIRAWSDMLKFCCGFC